MINCRIEGCFLFCDANQRFRSRAFALWSVDLVFLIVRQKMS